MSPIIEQPHPDDDFYSPELIRFAAAGFCVLSAAGAAFGLWIVNDAGCFTEKCGGVDGWSLGVYFLLMWAASQVALSVVGGAGFLFLVIANRSHPVAVSVASAGMLATAVLLGLALTGLWRGA